MPKTTTKYTIKIKTLSNQDLYFEYLEGMAIFWDASETTICGSLFDTLLEVEDVINDIKKDILNKDFGVFDGKAKEIDFNTLEIVVLEMVEVEKVSVELPEVSFNN